MDVLSAVILGLVQGIMEFLPVSSSGHLILINDLIHIDEVNRLAVGGILFLSTAFATMLYFWVDIWVLIQTLMRKLGRLPVNEKDLVLLYALSLGSIPALAIGLFLEPIFEKYLNNILLIAAVLLLSALFFMYAEWQYYQKPPHGTISIRKGWHIGLFQILALIPGFSRLGVTLAGGMLLGLSRFESAKFSFLLAIPLALGLGIKKLLDLIVIGGEVVWVPIMIASTISFVTALIVIHFFIYYIRRHTLWPFIWYNIILAMLAVYFISFV